MTTTTRLYSSETPSATLRTLPSPVWLKYCIASSYLSMRVAEQATEACPPHHGARLATNCPRPHDQLVVETLMIVLGIRMGQGLMDHIRQRWYPQHPHAI